MVKGAHYVQSIDRTLLNIIIIGQFEKKCRPAPRTS